MVLLTTAPGLPQLLGALVLSQVEDLLSLALVLHLHTQTHRQHARVLQQPGAENAGSQTLTWLLFIFR